MRIPKEEYNKAVECLKRYDYNCINIVNRQSDILSLSIAPISDMPRVPYGIGDTTLQKVLQLESDVDLQKSIKEYKAVVQALKLVNKDCKLIFEELYRKGNTKWQIIDSGMSEGTYKRRKSELIYIVYKELKKLSQF